MLPHNHFLIAGLVIAPLGFILFPEKPVSEIGEWVCIGGLVSAAVDLDIYTLTVLKSKKEGQLKIFRNPVEIYRHFKLFMETITETGVLKIGLISHFIVSALFIFIGYFYLNNYLWPIVLGVTSHLISDIQYLPRVMKGE